jgi:hypothetical protein
MTAYQQQQHGYTPTQAPSLVGQLIQESSLDPGAVDKTGAVSARTLQGHSECLAQAPSASLPNPSEAS